MRRIWLVFAQTVTVALALLFVVETLRPEWLSRFAAPRAPVASVSISAAPVPAAQGVVSYRAAAARAAPSVVNIFTSMVMN